MAGPEAAPVWFYANIIRGMLPTMEELGVDAADAAMIGPPRTAAWIGTPD